MSSLPSPAGATEIIVLIREIEEANRDIAEATRYVRTLRDSKELLGQLKRELRKKLEAMDCESAGNYGWDARFGWLLGEVIRQCEKETV